MEVEKIFFNYDLQPGLTKKKNIAKGDNKPLVSIITSYYNANKYMEQTINCVLNQTFPFWEWIIVDDGSTEEGTEGFLNYIKNKDPRIRIYKKQNEGLAKGRDYAIKYATTDYILPLDSDDLLDMTYIECAYWCAITNPEASWIYSNSLGFYKQQYLWKISFDSERMKKDNILTATALIKKDKIIELEGYGIAKRYVNEDWHLWLRMLSKGYFPVKMNFYGFWYRRCEQSLLSQINDKNQEENNLRIKDLEKEAEKIEQKVIAKEYPSNNLSEKEKVFEKVKWDKEFNKEKLGKRVLYILPYIKTDNRTYKYIKEEQQEPIVITTKVCPYIYRQMYEQYAEVFDLTSFLDKENWTKFIYYIIITRQIDKIVIINSNYGDNISNWLKKEFSNIPLEILHYKENKNLYYKIIRKYKKDHRIYKKIFRKVKKFIARKDVKK